MNTENELIKKAIAEKISRSNITQNEKDEILRGCDKALLVSGTLSREELLRLIDNADDDKKQRLMNIINNIK